MKTHNSPTSDSYAVGFGKRAGPRKPNKLEKLRQLRKQQKKDPESLTDAENNFVRTTLAEYEARWEAGDITRKTAISLDLAEPIAKTKDAKPSSDGWGWKI